MFDVLDRFSARAFRGCLFAGALKVGVDFDVAGANVSRVLEMLPNSRAYYCLRVTYVCI